jgi:hypothetical protein
VDPAEQGTQRGTAAQAGVHVRWLERGERGDAVLAQIGRVIAWIEIKPPIVATERSPGKYFSTSSLQEGLTLQIRSGQESRNQCQGYSSRLLNLVVRQMPCC